MRNLQIHRNKHIAFLNTELPEKKGGNRSLAPPEMKSGAGRLILLQSLKEKEEGEAE